MPRARRTPTPVRARPELQGRDPITPRRLTSTEAAARLGVKVQTLYAYVSRGLIGRETAADGRSSLFDTEEIDEFMNGRARADEPAPQPHIASSITRVDDAGLWVRGRELVSLSGEAYEDVVDILWESGSGEVWDVPQALLDGVADLQSEMPAAAQGLDRLRATVAFASASDPMRHDLSARSVRSAGRQLLTLMVDGLRDAKSGSPQGELLADRLWVALADRSGPPIQRDALNAAMVLLIDHGLAASNFAARVAGSVRADPYSAVCAGLGVVGGALHGAASSGVHEMLESAAGSRGAAHAVGAARRRLGVLPGFGHKVYETRDPRCEELMIWISRAWHDDPRLRVVSEVHDVIRSRTDAVPNIDLALGALTFLANMPPSAGEVIFAVSRTAGWIAHAAEEYAEEAHRFRVRARYVGPEPST